MLAALWMPLVAACTGSSPPEADGGAGGADVALTAAAVDEALPVGFETVSLTRTRRAGPHGGAEVGFAAAVGARRSDPRFVELTLFEFTLPIELERAETFVGKASDLEPQPLAGSGFPFAFLPDGAVPEQDVRASLELARAGPQAQSVFRGETDRGRLVVGGAAWMTPDDIDTLVPVLLERAEGGEIPDLPLGMAVIADTPLPEGVTVEIESSRGISVVELRDDVPEGWFDFLTWSNGPDVEASPFVDLARRTSVAPPSDFGPAGHPVDNTVLVTWDDGTLITITHPQLPDPVVRRLHGSFRGIAATQLWEQAEEPDAQEDAPAARQGRTVDAPDPERMAELQAYVEGARGVDFDGPLDYTFVDDPSGLGVGAMFIDAELWSVLRALGLTEPGQTRVAANQARIDRLRGVPGTVVLQDTTTETDVVIVHEMTHSADQLRHDDFPVDRRRELVSPTQAVVEGNAHRVASDFLRSLPADERQHAPDFPGVFTPSGDPRVSFAVQQILEFPYDEGLRFVAAVAEAEGPDAVDGLFADPPDSSEQVLFLDAWRRDDQPADVSAPLLPDGAATLGTGTLGAFAVLLVIESDPSTEYDGRSIAERWSGDTYLWYRQDDAECVAARIEMDTVDAARELAAAVGRDGRTVLRTDRTVEVQRCS